MLTQLLRSEPLEPRLENGKRLHYNFQFANLPFEREEIFSQRAFSIYCLENKGYIIWKLDKKERTYLVFDEQGN